MIAGAWFEKRKIPRLSFKDASLSHNEPTEQAPGDYALNANSAGLLYLVKSKAGAKVIINSELCDMKGVDLLKINRIGMELMSKIGLRTDDHQYLELYDTYLNMRNMGEKVAYIVAHLAETYHISESSVKRIICRFSREVRI